MKSVSKRTKLVDRQINFCDPAECEAHIKKITKKLMEAERKNKLWYKMYWVLMNEKTAWLNKARKLEWGLNEKHNDEFLAKTKRAWEGWGWKFPKLDVDKNNVPLFEVEGSADELTLVNIVAAPFEWRERLRIFSEDHIN